MFVLSDETPHAPDDFTASFCLCGDLGQSITNFRGICLSGIDQPPAAVRESGNGTQGLVQLMGYAGC
jgi:hypothetical protein